MSSRLLAPGLIAGLTAIAWWNRFVQDDAFISFRYARNWVQGEGLVWNPGDRVEGYSNFLWTVLMAVPIRMGWDPVLFSQLFGVACFAGSLWATWQLARRLGAPEAQSLLAVALLGTNYSFSCYATGGLETQAQALLWLLCCLLALGGLQAGGFDVRRAGLLSLTIAVALLTRLDSAIFAGVAAALAGWTLLRSEPGPQRRSALAALVLPAALLVGSWLAWKWSFYGELLPNSYYVKVASSTSLARGIYYLGIFLAVYLLLPLLLLHLAIARRWIRELGGLQWGLLVVPLLAWWLYVIRVGGDFMEFRFLVPSLPVLYIALSWSIWQLPGRRWAAPAIAVVLVAASIFHAFSFQGSVLRRGLESIQDLRLHIERDPSWVDVGNALGARFSANDGLLIGVTPAGAIPYQAAELRFVDMIGINDRAIARHGTLLSDRPGHQRMASIAQLRERGVNLVVGHPMLRSRARYQPASISLRELEPMFVGKPMPDPESLPDGAAVLLLPVGEDAVLLALYLEAHPVVEEQLQRGELRRVPLVRDAS